MRIVTGTTPEEIAYLSAVHLRRVLERKIARLRGVFIQQEQYDLNIYARFELDNDWYLYFPIEIGYEHCSEINLIRAKYTAITRAIYSFEWSAWDNA